MPSTDYIPSFMSAKMAWLQNFAVFVTANYAAVGLTLTDRDAINTAVDETTTAYALSTTAATRTPATIADTQAKMNNAIQLCRNYAQQVNNFAGTSDEQRAEAQITIRDEGKTPIAAPATYPVLEILNATPLQHKFTWHDSDALGPQIKAKPFGVIGAELRLSVGAAPPAAPEDGAMVGIITRAPFAVDLDPANVGQTAYYYARWITARGLTGPWSAVASMTIV